jgi:nucleoside-diphosphate-sugar epimerase
MTLASNANNNCLIMNVGSDEAVNIGGLALAVARFFGVSAIVPDIETSLIDRYIPSIKKATSTLGLGLKFNLHDSIEATINEVKRINALNLHR